MKLAENMTTGRKKGMFKRKLLLRDAGEEAFMKHSWLYIANTYIK